MIKIINIFIVYYKYVCIFVKQLMTNVYNMKTDYFTTKSFYNWFLSELEDFYSDTQTKEVEFFAEYNGYEVYALVECSYRMVDESFGHEFGTEESWGYELDCFVIEIINIIDQDGEELALDYQLIINELEK